MKGALIGATGLFGGSLAIALGVILAPIVLIVMVMSLAGGTAAAVGNCRTLVDAPQVKTYEFGHAVGDERHVAQLLVDVAVEQHLDGYAAATALVASMSTTGLSNATVRGIFDVEPGFVKDRTDIKASAREFYTRLAALQPEYHADSISDAAAAVLGIPSGANIIENEDAAWSWLIMTGYPMQGQYQLPLKAGSFQFQRGFRFGTNPITHVHKMHTGVDLSAALNTEIDAFADGKVVFAGAAGPGFGHAVIIDHPQLGITTMYGHMYADGVLVHTGQTVKQGDQIAAVGSDGQATGPHLHFEIRQSPTDALSQVSPYDWMFSGGLVRAVPDGGTCKNSSGSTPDPGSDALGPLERSAEARARRR